MTIQSAIAAMLAVFAVHQEDRGATEAKAYQERLLTDALVVESGRAPKGYSRREWSALLLAIVENETHGSLRIQEGNCKPWECDRGRARGPFQEQKNERNAVVWEQLVGVENTAIQVASANVALRLSFWHWRRHCQSATPDWVTGTLTVYAGRSCLTPWPGAAARAASFRKFVRAGT